MGKKNKNEGFEPSLLDSFQNFQPDSSKQVGLLSSSSSAKPLLVKRIEKKVDKNLIVFTKEELKEMVPISFDGNSDRSDSKNDYRDGEFYIACGYVASRMVYDDSADIVVGCGDEELKIHVSKKDSFFDKTIAANPGEIRLSILMCGNCCADVKLGPIFGAVGWRFKKSHSSGRIVIDYAVRA